jgi:hypothetical protein
MQDFSSVNAKWLRRDVLQSLSATAPRAMACSGRALQCIGVCAGGGGLAPRLTLSDTQNSVEAYPTAQCLAELVRTAELEEARELQGATLEVHAAELRSTWVGGGAGGGGAPRLHACLQATRLGFKGGSGNKRFGNPRPLAEDAQVLGHLARLGGDPQALRERAPLEPAAEARLWAALGLAEGFIGAAVPLQRAEVPAAAAARHEAALAAAGWRARAPQAAAAAAAAGAAAAAPPARAPGSSSSSSSGKRRREGDSAAASQGGSRENSQDMLATQLDELACMEAAPPARAAPAAASLSASARGSRSSSRLPTGSGAGAAPPPPRQPEPPRSSRGLQRGKSAEAQDEVPTQRQEPRVPITLGRGLWGVAFSPYSFSACCVSGVK